MQAQTLFQTLHLIIIQYERINIARKESNFFLFLTTQESCIENCLPKKKRTVKSGLSCVVIIYKITLEIVYITFLFNTNVSKPFKIKCFTWKYNIVNYHCIYQKRSSMDELFSMRMPNKLNNNTRLNKYCFKISINKPCIMYAICWSVSFNWSEKMTKRCFHISLNIPVHIIPFSCIKEGYLIF